MAGMKHLRLTHKSGSGKDQWLPKVDKPRFGFLFHRVIVSQYNSRALSLEKKRTKHITSSFMQKSDDFQNEHGRRMGQKRTEALVGDSSIPGSAWVKRLLQCKEGLRLGGEQ